MPTSSRRYRVSLTGAWRRNRWGVHRHGVRWWMVRRAGRCGHRPLQDAYDDTNTERNGVPGGGNGKTAAHHPARGGDGGFGAVGDGPGDCAICGWRYGRLGISPAAAGDQRLCLWKPRFFEKNRVKLLYWGAPFYCLLRRYSKISAALVSGFTLGMTFSITPFPSMTKVDRTTPMDTFP